VDKGLVPLVNSNNESWCQGLDGLAQRTAEYYKQGARFAKWRGVISIPAGPSQLALRETAYALARYAAISQVGFEARKFRSPFGSTVLWLLDTKLLRSVYLFFPQEFEGNLPGRTHAFFPFCLALECTGPWVHGP
jgi:Fructose-bisphosphate aldolase class-I